MCTSDAASDREAEPSARRTLVVRAAIEALEDPVELIGVESASGVGDVDPCRVMSSSGGDRDRSAGWCVGEGIAEEVGEDLADAAKCPAERNRPTSPTIVKIVAAPMSPIPKMAVRVVP